MRKLSIIITIIAMTTAFLLLMAGEASADVTGIDVSQWQGTIDWNAVYGNTSFAMIKAGGSDNGLYTDAQFARNQAEARRLGIYRGYYYYTGGCNPIAEAEHFASIVGPLQPGEIVALDLEIDMPNPVGFTWQFMVRAEQLLGVKPLLYTNMNRVWNNNWQLVVDNGNKLWGALYDQNQNAYPPSGSWSDLAIKQFTSEGSVPGITANSVDVNVFRKNSDDFPSLGYVPPPPPSPATPAPAPVVEEVKPASDAAMAVYPQGGEEKPAIDAAPGTSSVLKDGRSGTAQGQEPAKDQATADNSKASNPTFSVPANRPGDGEKAVEVLLNPIIGSKADGGVNNVTSPGQKTPAGSVENAVLSVVSKL